MHIYRTLTNVEDKKMKQKHARLTAGTAQKEPLRKRWTRERTGARKDDRRCFHVYLEIRFPRKLPLRDEWPIRREQYPPINKKGVVSYPPPTHTNTHKLRGQPSAGFTSLRGGGCSSSTPEGEAEAHGARSEALRASATINGPLFGMPKLRTDK